MHKFKAIINKKFNGIQLLEKFINIHKKNTSEVQNIADKDGSIMSIHQKIGTSYIYIEANGLLNKIQH